MLLIGDGPQRPVWERLAADLGVPFTSLGWLRGDDRWAALRQAAVLAVPSTWPEPFGLVGLEAARFGVPTVAFDSGGVRTWLVDGVNGLLVPANAGSRGFGKALASVLREPVRLAKLSAGAIAASARFSKAAHLASLTRVLTEWPSSGTC